MLKNTRLRLINGDLQTALRSKSPSKIPVQVVPSVDLIVYSPNPRVNSVVRTLVALHGEDNLFNAAMAWSFTPEGEAFSADDTEELLATIKWVSAYRGEA